MKKKILAIAMATAIIATSTIPVLAVTPQYKPVSKQPWYKNYQTALKSAYEAGKEAVKDIEFHFDFSGIDLGKIDFSKIVLK